MKFLADESCDFAIVRALRDVGHDIVAVAEHHAGAEDSFVIELARSESRLLITEDSDFGQLVFAAARETAGVIFVRWPTLARATLPQAMVKLVADHGSTLINAFVVVEPGRFRFSTGP
jgi:predicted nuclease of predicted toxin-antitoxin system